MAIRMARSAGNSHGGPPKVHTYRDNDSRPDKCFTTSRAVKTGKANACSGKIFVTIPPDHFGPITAEHDPTRGQGVLVGEFWEDRMECRQWGAHLPHVAGIAGQSDYGSQSVALSGGYEDDEDHGEWFLYTGSGGRDLSGNKRTNKEQSFDQKFDKMNEALRVSCKQGYPVRVVRSHKEKRSSYAPEAGVRYDGVYRIEKCWRKKGMQGHKVCRYLFVRCDNEPAPWTSDEHGDRPRPLPVVEELQSATDIFERKLSPAWAYQEGAGWGWTRGPPVSKKTSGGSSESTQKRKQLSIQQRLLKEFGCNACRKVLNQPLSMPCGHNFCKGCLDTAFAGQDSTRERKGVSGRSLRTQKVVKRCPNCKADITDFLVSPQVNRQMEEIIQTLQNTANNEQAIDLMDDADDTGEDSKPEDDDITEADLQAETETTVEDKAMKDCSTTPSMCVVADPVANGHSLNRDATSELPLVPVNTTKVDDTPQRTDAPNATTDPAFLALCQAFPEYSEDLLRSMLADQEGDIEELKSLLSALQRQQLRAQSRGRGRSRKGGPSGSDKELSNGNDCTSKDPAEEAVANGNGHMSMDGVEAVACGNGHASIEQLEKLVANGNGHASCELVKEAVSNVKGLASGEPMQCTTTKEKGGAKSEPTAVEAPDKGKKRRRGRGDGEDNDSNLNGKDRKKTRASVVELPLRVSRSRGCKETRSAVTQVDVSSDDDFQ